MIQIVQKLNFKRQRGKLYFVDHKGDLVEITPRQKKRKVVAKLRIKKEKGYLYFLNKQGHIARTPMKNSRKK